MHLAVAAAVFLLKLNSDSEGTKTQICYLKVGTSYGSKKMAGYVKSKGPQSSRCQVRESL